MILRWMIHGLRIYHCLHFFWFLEMWDEAMRILLAFDTPNEIVCVFCFVYLSDLVMLVNVFHCVEHDLYIYIYYGRVGVEMDGKSTLWFGI